jgi:integrase
MPPNAPDERLEQELDRLEVADIPETDREAIRTTIDDLNEYNQPRNRPSKTTKSEYCKNLRLLSKDADAPLSEMGPPGLNAAMNALSDDKGWSDSTVAQYQSALKALGAYLGHDREDIDIDSTPRSGGQVDPRTVMTPDQFHAIRENADNMRDRAIIDLLGYTGQRVRAIQTLRIGDVDTDEGIWYMPDADGLKGAEKVGKRRPLLGAVNSVSEWIQMHPTGGPDDTLITALPHGPNGDVGGEISRQTIARRIRQAADRAGIDTDETPVNPHAFRHFFVTVAKEQYDLDDGVVKFLIGHADGSNVMATTYRHLSDEFYVDKAEQAFGLSDGDDERGLAPPVCPTCGTPLRPDAESCPTPTCNEVFAPSQGGEAGTDASTSDNPIAAAILQAAEEHGEEKAGDLLADAVSEVTDALED